MVEGRITAGVVVGDGSDIGGGASIMGTLSGGGTEVISIGERCLLGANAGVGISLGDDCVVEAGCYVTAGTKVTMLDIDGKPKVVKAARALGRQQRPLPPQLGDRRGRGRAVEARGDRAQRRPARQLAGSPVGRRWPVVLVGRRRAGRWPRSGSAPTCYDQVSPYLHSERCTAEVDGESVALDPRAGRERRPDRARSPYAAACRPGP